jgi:hypothetical protein
MTTRLEAPLKRELDIAGEPWTLTITTEGFALAPKGRRKGLTMSWTSFVSGEAALAASLNASLHDRVPPASNRTREAPEVHPHEHAANLKHEASVARLRRVK